MKIAIRGGHNFQARGASALIDETTEDRRVKAATIDYLKGLGHEVLDVTPVDCDVNTDLAYGVNTANSWGAEYFISIHFNKAYDNYDGPIGTEAWIYATGGKAQPMAERITGKLATTGLINRGVKVSTGLYELKYTNMSALIVEVCFVEATKDVAIYQSVGPNTIGRLIAEGIANQSISQSAPAPVKEVKKVKAVVIHNGDPDKRAAEYLADALQCSACHKDNVTADLLEAATAVYVVGGSWKPRADATLISGQNRFGTLAATLEEIKKITEVR